MLHPDYQYPPKLITAMTGLLTSEIFDIVLSSRILCGIATKAGMPLYKYVANGILTFVENLLLLQKLSEYHSWYRIFLGEVLLNLPILENSDDFIFDNEILVQAFYFGHRIGEVSSPSKYTRESSSIGFKRSVIYGLGVILTSFKFCLQKFKLARFPIFKENVKKIEIPWSLKTSRCSLSPILPSLTHDCI